MGNEEAKTLFHYTDQSGLIGILSSQVIWASDSQFLNDTKELRFGFEVLIRELRTNSFAERGTLSQQEFTGSGAPHIAAKLHTAADFLERSGQFGEEHTPIVYVCSFSAVADSLSQWRGYGGNGGGFAIGFDKEVLAGLASASSDSSGRGDPRRSVVGPLKMAYGEQGARAAARDLILAVQHDRAPNHPVPSGIALATNECIRMLASTKNGAFADEEEYRLLVAGMQEDSRGEHAAVKFRVGASAPTPYIELPLPPSAFASIVVGPGGNRTLREDVCQRMLNRFGLQHVQILHSQVPYRA